MFSTWFFIQMPLWRAPVLAKQRASEWAMEENSDRGSPRMATSVNSRKFILPNWRLTILHFEQWCKKIVLIIMKFSINAGGSVLSSFSDLFTSCTSPLIELLISGSQWTWKSSCYKVPQVPFFSSNLKKNENFLPLFYICLRFRWYSAPEIFVALWLWIAKQPNELFAPVSSSWSLWIFIWII